MAAFALFPAVKIAELRRDYAKAALTEKDVDPDPVRQFERWLGEAIKAELPEPTAMTLATVDAGGNPDARIVLLKGVDARGLVIESRGPGAVDEEAQPVVRLRRLIHALELKQLAPPG